MRFHCMQCTNIHVHYIKYKYITAKVAGVKAAGYH